MGWTLLGRNIVGSYFFYCIYIMNSIGFNQQSITSKMIYIQHSFALFLLDFFLWSENKIGTQSQSKRERDRTVWTVVRKLLNSETRLLLLHLLVFPNHFYYLLNEYVTILRCSLIFIARKFTPFILTAKNKGIELIFPIAHSTTSKNRFFFTYSSEIILHSQFESNVMQTTNYERAY